MLQLLNRHTIAYSSSQSNLKLEIYTWPRTGLVKATSLILRTQEDGLAIGGPPCGPWIFLNSGTHGRKMRNIWGNLRSKYVQASNQLHDQNLDRYIARSLDRNNWKVLEITNEISIYDISLVQSQKASQQPRLVARWCLLSILAAARCVYTLTEQPGGSMMRRYPYLRHIAAVLQRLGCPWMETFLSSPHLLIQLTGDFKMFCMQSCYNNSISMRGSGQVTCCRGDIRRWSPQEPWVQRFVLSIFRLEYGSCLFLIWSKFFGMKMPLLEAMGKELPEKGPQAQAGQNESQRI